LNVRQGHEFELRDIIALGDAGQHLAVIMNAGRFHKRML
jgi:hypothetical protein